MLNLLGKDPKTTVAGWIAGAAAMWPALYDLWGHGRFTHQALPSLLLGTALIVLGHVSRDSPQPTQAHP